MEFTFDNNLPIYIQLVDQLKVYIISGVLAPGERLASVRELAMQTKVNPNTVQKAMVELEQMGLIYTERTNGKFVSTDVEKIAVLRNEYAAAVSRRFLEDMQKLGFDKARSIACLETMEGEIF